jgi:hypothetical protein
LCGNLIFPFGYGLSYTEFEYSKFKLSSNTLNRGSSIKAAIEVKNTGAVKGKELEKQITGAQEIVNATLEVAKKSLRCNINRDQDQIQKLKGFLDETLLLQFFVLNQRL